MVFSDSVANQLSLQNLTVLFHGASRASLIAAESIFGGFPTLLVLTLFYPKWSDILLGVREGKFFFAIMIAHGSIRRTAHCQQVLWFHSSMEKFRYLNYLALQLINVCGGTTRESKQNFLLAFEALKCCATICESLFDWRESKSAGFLRKNKT